MGVGVIAVDDTKNSVLIPNFEAVTGFDAVRHDNIVVRAMTAPNLEDTKEKIMFVILIAIAIGVGFCIYFLFFQGDRITQCKQAVDGLKPFIQEALKQTTGNI